MLLLLKNKYLVLVILLITLKVNAILLPGTDEYKEAHIEHYTKVTELIVIGEIMHTIQMGTYIKVTDILKGDKRLKNKELTIYKLISGMDITCGAGKPEIPLPVNKAIAMFTYDTYNLDRPPIFINSYVKPERIKKIKKLLRHVN